MAKAKTSAKAETKTEEKPKVEVKALTKAISVIRQWKEAASKVTALFDQLGQVVRDEAQRLKYDESQTRQAVFLSLEEAYEFDGDDNDREKFRKRFQPEVSKILRMAFPVDAKAEAQLEIAREHNADASLHDRIGANDMLEIARGSKTAAAIISHKAAKKKSKKEGFTAELFSSNIAEQISKARKAGITLAAARKIVDRLFAQWDKQDTEEVPETETE